MNNKTSKFLVVILNWNGIDDTLDCIKSILAVYDKHCPSILVVDNGSENNETVLIRSQIPHPSLHFLRLNQNMGYCGGNNAGCDWAKDHGYDKLLILNNDTIVKDAVFEKLVDRLDNNIAIAGATIVDYKQNKIIQNRGFRYNYILGTSFAVDEKAIISKNDHGFTEAFVSGACFAIDLNALGDEKLFDPGFFCYFEEIDLCLRLSAKNLKSVIINDAYIYHKGEASSSKITGFSEYQMARNRLWLIKKNKMRLKYLLPLMVNIILYFPFRILKLLFSADRSKIKYFVSGFGAGLFRSQNEK